MVRRKTIGKIQISLGIILLLIVIIGSIIAFMGINKFFLSEDEEIRNIFSIEDIKNKTAEVSNETKKIIVYDALTSFYMESKDIKFNTILITTIGGVSAAILFILSLILILEGLANLNEESRVISRKW